ncbi:MAG TPA: hypothetical protein VEZ24_12425 [Microvirga sp.]|nr:hypothetical protein [Microvirga sp.]
MSSTFELDATTRTALRKQLRTHPEIRKHVKTVSEINSYKKAKLLALATKLGIDLDETKRNAFQMVRLNHPFEGTLEIDIAFELLGQKITRKLRITQEFTPQWDYFDLNEQMVVTTAGGGMSDKWEIYAIHEHLEVGEKGRRARVRKPSWVPMEDLYKDGILTQAVEDLIDALFEARFQQVNEARLDAAAIYSPEERERFRKAYPDWVRETLAGASGLNTNELISRIVVKSE